MPPVDLVLSTGTTFQTELAARDGDFATGIRTAFAAITATVLIVLLNIVLIRQMLL
jgi:hypothetical protein